MEKKFECEYTYDEISKAMTVIPVYKKLTMLLIIIAFIIMSGVFLALGIIFGDAFVIGCGIVVAVLTALIIVFSVLLLPGVRMKLFYNRTKKANQVFKNGVHFDYSFTDSKITINSTFGNSNSSVELDYIEITKFLYNKENIYFFINNVNCYVIKREVITNADINEILELVSKKAKKGYSIVK